MNRLVHDHLDDVAVVIVIDGDLVVLIDPELGGDVLGFDIILEAEIRRIDVQLIELTWMDAGLQIVDSQKLLALVKRDGIRRPKGVRGIEQNHFRFHPESDRIVDVHVQGLVISGKSDPHADQTLGKLVKLGPSLSGELGLVDLDEVFVVIVDPMVLARAKDRVTALERGMVVESHDHPFIRKSLVR